MTRDDEAQVLRRMLPAPDERDFPAGRRHQREDHLMTSIQHLSRRSDQRRRLTAGLGLPVAVATAAVAAVVALGPSVSAPARLAPGPPSVALGSPSAAPVPPSVAAGAGPGTTTARIITVGYVLAAEPGDTVKITVRPGAAGTVDPARFQQDLAAMGIQATVSRGTSRAYARATTTTLATRDQSGNYEARVSRRVPTPVRQLILFPIGEPTPQGWQAVDVLSVSITHR